MKDRVVANRSTIRLLTALAVNAGWAANDLSRPEAERRSMPPQDLEAAVQGVLDEMTLEGQRQIPEAVSRLYGPDGKRMGTVN